MMILAPPRMIPQETIEQVAAANDIVEIIGSYLPLKRAGANFTALCPFHREKSPSFNVSPSRQSFKCFGCGVGGTVFKFVTLYQSIDFPTAVRQLAQRAGIAVVEENFGGQAEDQGERQSRRRLLALHAAASDWFHRNLMKTAGGQVARDYLKTRGLTQEVAARWKIGYAPENSKSCLRWAVSAGFAEQEVIDGGLAAGGEEGLYDRFRHRLMFPICNETGEVIAFSGRALATDVKAKYVNSPETPLFKKGKVLFGLHMSNRALLDAKFAIVCEGQIDLITAFEAGIRNVIAPQGTAFTEDQARLLKRKADEVVLCFDADAAGQQAAEKSLTVLLASNVNVRVATMPAGEDPDSLIRTQGADAFKARIAEAKDFFDFQIERLSAVFDLNTPRGKAQFCRRMADSVVLLTDVVLREAVVGKISARVGIAASDFRALLKKRPTSGAMQPEVDLLGAGAASGDAGTESAESFERPSIAVSNLLKVAMENEDARGWLLEQSWEELLPKIAGAETLIKVLSADLIANHLPSTAAFLAALPAQEEAFLAGLLMEKPVAQPMIVARDCWCGLEKRLLVEQLTALQGRMGLPDVSTEEVTRLQKEVLDLQRRLKDIARP